MKVTKRVNTGTVSIDFSDPESCKEAIAYIAENGNIEMGADIVYEYQKSFDGNGHDFRPVKTSRIKLIKFVRAYGQFVVENGGACGLRHAKYFFDKNEDTLIHKEQQ